MRWIRLMLVLCVLPLADAQPGEMWGSWSATYGPQRYQGSWTADAKGESDSGWGTWRLLDAAGNTLMGGTWSMRKAADEWRGSWRAEVKGSAAVYMGTWDSSLKKAGNAAFREMLEAAAKEVVSGTWEAPGGRHGAWSIRAAPGK
jgi:hypothetical protein